MQSNVDHPRMHAISLSVVTWQRWRSLHSIRRRSKTRCCMQILWFGVMGNQSFTLWELGFSAFFAQVTLILTWWRSYMNLTSIPWRHTRCAKLWEDFQKLSSYSLWMCAGTKVPAANWPEFYWPIHSREQKCSVPSAWLQNSPYKHCTGRTVLEYEASSRITNPSFHTRICIIWTWRCLPRSRAAAREGNALKMDPARHWLHSIVSTPHARSQTTQEDGRDIDAWWSYLRLCLLFVVTSYNARTTDSPILLYGSWFSTAWRHCLLWANEHVRNYKHRLALESP